jgi:hypothetical protein
MRDTCGEPQFSGTNITVFVLFFGIALIEALRNNNWLEAALFLALGAMSLWVDVKKRRRAVSRRNDAPATT